MLVNRFEKLGLAVEVVEQKRLGHADPLRQVACISLQPHIREEGDRAFYDLSPSFLRCEAAALRRFGGFGAGFSRLAFFHIRCRSSPEKKSLALLSDL